MDSKIAGFRFDALNHKYYLDGNRLPSVTEILKPLSEYCGVSRQVLEHAADRGNYIHKCCEMDMYGILDMSSVPDEYVPYIDAFRKFVVEKKFTPKLIEQRVYHSKLRYAGTLDIEGEFEGGNSDDIVDIKTTARFMPSVGPQTMAYKKARGGKGNRFALQLKNNGDYSLVKLNQDARDWSVFVSCLNIYNFMVN